MKFWGLGVSAILSFACASSDKGTSDSTGTNVTPAPTTADVAPPAPETCSDNPLLAGCSTAGNSQTPTKPTTAGGNTNSNSNSSDPAALAKAAAENVLASNCGQCHGPNLTPQTAQAGMNYINDIDKLVQNGKIVPLDSANSLIIQRMKRGEVPPVSSGLPAVTDADINTVAQYIDNPRFWPNAAPTSDCQNKEQLVDTDKLFQTINEDLSRADGKDRPFYRYVSLTNATPPVSAPMRSTKSARA